MSLAPATTSTSQRRPWSAGPSTCTPRASPCAVASTRKPRLPSLGHHRLVAGLAGAGRIGRIGQVRQHGRILDRVTPHDRRRVSALRTACSPYRAAALAYSGPWSPAAPVAIVDVVVRDQRHRRRATADRRRIVVDDRADGLAVGQRRAGHIGHVTERSRSAPPTVSPLMPTVKILLVAPAAIDWPVRALGHVIGARRSRCRWRWRCCRSPHCWRCRQLHREGRLLAEGVALGDRDIADDSVGVPPPPPSSLLIVPVAWPSARVAPTTLAEVHGEASRRLRRRVAVDGHREGLAGGPGGNRLAGQAAGDIVAARRRRAIGGGDVDRSPRQRPPPTG